MELFVAIAMLCQYSLGTGERHTVNNQQASLDCQQYYTHCVNTKTSITKPEAMTKCIMERKL